MVVPQDSIPDEYLLRRQRKMRYIDKYLTPIFFDLLHLLVPYIVFPDKFKQIDIDYYNTQRITTKLKGLTPIEYRNQSSLIA